MEDKVFPEVEHIGRYGPLLVRVAVLALDIYGSAQDLERRDVHVIPDVFFYIFLFELFGAGGEAEEHHED